MRNSAISRQKWRVKCAGQAENILTLIAVSSQLTPRPAAQTYCSPAVSALHNTGDCIVHSLPHLFVHIKSVQVCLLYNLYYVKMVAFLVSKSHMNKSTDFWKICIFKRFHSQSCLFRSVIFFLYCAFFTPCKQPYVIPSIYKLRISSYPHIVCLNPPWEPESARLSLSPTRVFAADCCASPSPPSLLILLPAVARIGRRTVCRVQSTPH